MHAEGIRAGAREQRALGRAVRETRARRCLSQEQLGFASGLHRVYVGAIERGEINPTLRTLLAFTVGLDVPLGELVEVYERQLRDAA
jgi:transcriptional regulator with XRE-family HTH domain